MIAVFCYDRTQLEIDCRPTPSKKFKIIETEEDVRGRKFDAVMEFRYAFDCGNSIKDEKKFKAYQILKNRQPELFK